MARHSACVPRKAGGLVIPKPEEAHDRSKVIRDDASMKPRKFALMCNLVGFCRSLVGAHTAKACRVTTCRATCWQQAQSSRRA